MNRQQVLNQLRLMQARHEDNGDGPNADYDAICFAIEAIERSEDLEKLITALETEHAKLREMQKAQPEQDWILVSERMPEEREWIGTKRFGTTISDEVYVTFETTKGERFRKHIRFQNGKLNSADQHTIDAINKGSKPVAWKPLPEPWEGDAE